MILGYILVAIAINIKGDVVGKSLNYYMTKQNCYTAKLKQEKLSDNYTCKLDEIIKVR